MKRPPIEAERRPEQLNNVQEQPLQQPKEVALEVVHSNEVPQAEDGQTEFKEHQVAEARERLEEIGRSPLERAIDANEGVVPPHPGIEELGTSETREGLPAYHEQAQKLFEELEALKENPNARHADFERVVLNIRQVVAGEIALLTKDPNKKVDQEYVAFLRRLEGESQIVASKLHELGGKLFMGATRERIVFREFESKLELMELFPDVAPEELLANPDLLKRKLQERYGDLEIEIKPLSDFKSHIKAAAKGWKGVAFAGYGAVGGALTGYVLTFAISEGSMSVFVGAYLTPPHCR